MTVKIGSHDKHGGFQSTNNRSDVAMYTYYRKCPPKDPKIKKLQKKKRKNNLRSEKHEHFCISNAILGSRKLRIVNSRGLNTYAASIKKYSSK